MGVPFLKTSADPKELIPEEAGSGIRRRTVQNRTLALWTSLALFGSSLFYGTKLPPQIRAATLGLAFPGAGYMASGNVVAICLLLVTFITIPISLIAWFAAGGFFFPILLWGLSIGGTYLVTSTEESKLWKPAGLVAPLLLLAFFLYCNRRTARVRKRQLEKRQERNTFIASEFAKIRARAVTPPVDEDRELSLQELRDIQYGIDLGLRDRDDWSDFGVLDQFQTASLRYKLYEMMFCLGIYQGVYAPNFHSYASEAFRKTIEKSLTSKVLSYWKWETLWGKFSTDFDPVKADNIMVSGFILEGVMLYTANTGDLRYTKPGSLRFEVDKSHFYDYDVHSLDAALVRQWERNPYCLFPCEPTWIYTPCNLQGITGQSVYDRVFNTDHAKRLMPSFEDSFVSNFTEIDGSVVPIRSEITGFTIPGLCGVLSDLLNALLCRASLPHVAARMWAFFCHECLRFNQETGELHIEGLAGADHIDPGTYKKSDFAMYPAVAYVAGEYGDEEVRKAALKVLDDNWGVHTTETGATCLPPEKASLPINMGKVRASLLRKDDWRKLICEGPSQKTLDGPVLSSVPYPGALVAKARSHTSRDLDLVLYPSKEPGSFEIGISKLEPDSEYSYGDGLVVRANAQGETNITIEVDGRTEVKIMPVHQARL